MIILALAVLHDFVRIFSWFCNFPVNMPPMRNKRALLTHKDLCNSRELAEINESKEFRQKLRSSFRASYAQAIQGNAIWGREITPIEAIAGRKSDVITAAILEDCPECFDFIRQRVPAMDGTGCNVDGWSFVAIAAYSGSIRMLNHFFTMDSLYAMSALSLLVLPAHPAQMFPTPLGILVQRQDRQTLETFIGSLAQSDRQFLYETRSSFESSLPRGTRIRGALTNEDKYQLCTFATPSLRQQFATMGIMLHDVTTTLSATSYHAAVSNGPEFLDYLKQNSTLSLAACDKNGETPLHYAVRANRLDSVQWLKKHDTAQVVYRTSTRVNGVVPGLMHWDKTAAHLAAELTTPESELILSELLPNPQHPLNILISASLLRSLMDGLRKTLQAHDEAGGADPDARSAYLNLHEKRATRKCEDILLVTENRSAAKYEDFFPTLADRAAIAEHRLVLQMARDIGFGCLAQAIQGPCNGSLMLW